MAAPPLRKLRTICCVTSRGIGADALVGDAVVGGKNVHRLLRDRGRVFLAPGNILRRHGFDLPQAAERLGQRIEMLLRFAQSLLVGCRNIGDRLLDRRRLQLQLRVFSSASTTRLRR